MKNLQPMEAGPDLWIKIEEAYNGGECPRSIARNLDIPLAWVMGVLEEVEFYYEQNEGF